MGITSFSHLLFDLDHTLWDFERNSEETLRELYRENDLGKGFGSEDDFLRIYHPINDSLWSAYGQGKITRKEVKYDRFALSLRKVGLVNSELAQYLAEEYVVRSPRKANLMPGALEVLEILSKTGTIIIVTNGFNEVQYRKIELSGLSPFVDKIITSENAGYQKPDSRFFDFLLKETGVQVDRGLMIGDNLITDIQGAKDYGFKTVFYNPLGKDDVVGATFEIERLLDILEL